MNFKELLTFAIAQRASDLHLTSNYALHLRIDGAIQALNNIIISSTWMQDFIQTTLTGFQQEQLNNCYELDCAYELSELARCRLHIYKQRTGWAAAIRLIPNQVLSLAELQLPPVLLQLMQLKQGLVLVTGATGSGKTTTLAALIAAINTTQAKHIVTIEDPIEYIHPVKASLINQREVQRDTLSFNAALRAVLREDPDVILIGELRDVETIRLALTAAETGHLVLATVHTSSAAKTIHRLVEVFPPEEQPAVRLILAETLQAIICQQLIPKIAGGRIANVEVLVVTPAVRNLIRENKVVQIYSVMQTSSNIGMQTFEQHLDQLSKQGTIAC